MLILRQSMIRSTNRLISVISAESSCAVRRRLRAADDRSGCHLAIFVAGRRQDKARPGLPPSRLIWFGWSTISHLGSGRSWSCNRNPKSTKGDVEKAVEAVEDCKPTAADLLPGKLSISKVKQHRGVGWTYGLRSGGRRKREDPDVRRNLGSVILGARSG